MGGFCSRFRADVMEMQDSPADEPVAGTHVVKSCEENPGVVYYCRSCEFEVLQKKTKLMTILEWAFLFAELFFGLMLFFIEIHYDLAIEIFGRYYVTHSAERNARSMLSRCRLIHCITGSFPFVFVPIILLTKAVMRRDSVIAVTCMIFGIVGFLCYFICAVMVLAVDHLDATSNLAVILFGVVALLTSFIYLGHAIFEIFRNATYIRRRFAAVCCSCRKRRRAE